MSESKTTVHIVGAGLAGSECAWQLARRGHQVKLFEMRGATMTPAHKTADFAELVCSNSFGSETDYSAPGQLKWEARQMGSLILQAAEHAKVPAGMALGVDRVRFAQFITEKIRNHPLIEVVEKVVDSLDEVPRPAVISTGPLTHDRLAESLRQHFDSEFLYFFDAIAPVIDADSIDKSIAFKADRFNRGTRDYYNCGMEKDQYLAFVSEIQNARKVEPKEFEKNTPYFEGCMPIEAMIERGIQTPRFGPMSPKGLRNLEQGDRGYYAVVQLRQENKEATAYNMVGFQTKMAYGEQTRIFRMIPGLENAEFLKLGSIHRNLYIQSPKKLTPFLQSRKDENLFFAGQITGVEGYFDSTCMGLLVGRFVSEKLNSKPMRKPPRTTAFGSLLNAITEDNDHFQPTNINFGAFPNLADFEVRNKNDKREKKERQLARAKEDLLEFLGLAPQPRTEPALHSGEPVCEPLPIPAPDGVWSASLGEKRPTLWGTFVALALTLALGWPPSALSEDKTPTTSEAFNTILTDFTEASKKQDFFSAPYFNDEANFDKFGDYPSKEYLQRANELTNTTLEKIKKIDPKQLQLKDHRAYLLFKDKLEIRKAAQDFPQFYLDVTQMGSRFRNYLDDSSPENGSFPFKTIKHFDAWVKRSEGFLPYVDRQISFMREGVEKKYVLNCVIAGKVMATIADGLEPEIEKHPFYRPLAKLPKDTSKKDRERLTQDFKAMIKDRIQPGFQKFATFFKEEYQPKCRQSYGIGSLPRGSEIYKYAIRAYTSLNLNADDVHRTGIKEVKRIRAEIEKIKKKMGFKGTLNAFFESRRKNEANYFSSKEEALARYNALKETIDAKLPQFFTAIPKSDYKILESENPHDAPASYKGPTELLPYGRFFVNTLNLRSSDRSAATSLSLHEANPGHHFQIALQFEMKDQLSEYQRKLYWSSAFSEGWGLYAEYLGNEMGLLDDPEQRLGQLSMELWRAVRLVVDTGIHAKGWSRERTLAYMKDNMNASAEAIEIEADRYSVWPGQAVSYKIGQLQILELRRKAEKKLGSNFDLREFHQAVLGSGTVSLPVLATQIDDWVKSRAGLKR